MKLFLIGVFFGCSGSLHLCLTSSPDDARRNNSVGYKFSDD